MIQLFITIYAGFTHAFEADHLLAVGNLVTTRKKLGHALKDGLYWGLGHTSTIVMVGLLMLLFKLAIPVHVFHYLEALVGCMLISLGGFRIFRHYSPPKKGTSSEAGKGSNRHSLAYGVGLVHGLAGSGTLVVLIMSQISQPLQGLRYLLIFGLGSVMGMLFAALLLSLPLSKQFIRSSRLQSTLVVVSALLCFCYGSKVVYENLFL